MLCQYKFGCAPACLFFCLQPAPVRIYSATRCALYPRAKIVQMSVKKTCFHLTECSLSYAKIVQMSVKKTCFHLTECSLSYAKILQSPQMAKDKIDYFLQKAYNFVRNCDCILKKTDGEGNVCMSSAFPFIGYNGILTVPSKREKHLFKDISCCHLSANERFGIEGRLPAGARNCT